MFSILILTKDEELNLEACLDSISWCDDIWILDSGSTDRTLEIAGNRGCHILRREFDNFGDQRNYAIDTATFKYQWVFDLDADERFTPALKAECEDLVRRDEKSAYFVSNKMMLLGKWIKHSSQFPVYQMRFHKLGEIRFIPYGHGQREGEAKRGLGYCREPYVHYNFSKGLWDWFQKHANYALREAEQQIVDEKRRLKIEGHDAPSKRRRLKRLVANFPGRPWIKLIYLLFVKRGILDGPAGWLYCRMQAHYEFMCVTILRDLRERKWRAKAEAADEPKGRLSLKNYRNEHGFGNKVARFAWNLVWLLLFRPTPRVALFSRWRVFLLKLFGAKVAWSVNVLPGCRIWQPWRLTIGANSWVDGDVNLYSVDEIRIGHDAVVSEGTYVCTASHDLASETFALTTAPVEIGDCAWVCARAIVLPRVKIGEGAVVAAGAVVTRDVEPWAVVGGIPAKFIKKREL